MSKEPFPQPSPHFIQVFRPVPTRLNFNSNLLNSLSSPMVHVSPISLSKTFALNLNSVCVENSGFSNNSHSIIPTKLEIHQRNPMTIHFDDFFSYNQNTQTQKLTQNFFKGENYFTKANNDYQIKSILFDEGNTTEKTKDNSYIKEREILFNKKIPNLFDSLDNIGNDICGKTMVTNIVNNFFVNFNDEHKFKHKKRSKIQMDLCKRKRWRKASLKKSTNRLRKIKKKDNALISIKLNQICTNNFSLLKFPIIPLPDDEISVEFVKRMLIEEDYFEVIDKNYSNETVIEEKIYNTESFIKKFLKEKEKLSDVLYLIEENESETNPIKIIKNFYMQIKQTVLTIQKNFIGKKKNSLNEEQSIKLQRLIESCNDVTNIITDYKNIGRKKDKISSNFNIKNNVINQKDKKRNNKKKHLKTYICEFCNKAYTNGQGLGGHISRIHPNQSYKYKDKIRIRNERVEKRMKLFEIKKKLFNKHGMDLEKMMKENNKKLIQKFLIDNKEEYYKIRKEEHKKVLLEQVKENEERGFESNDEIFTLC